MSAALKLSVWISPEEYLEGELLSDLRHEYILGEVRAMAGASETHNRISGNLFSEIHQHLKGRPCEAFMNDMKARVQRAEGSVFYYPDVLVCCDPRDRGEYHRDRPKMIFEVLSHSTEGIDRFEKRGHYITLPSLEIYVLVSQTKRELIVYRRALSWEPEVLDATAPSLRLEPINLDLPLDEIYRRTQL